MVKSVAAELEDEQDEAAESASNLGNLDAELDFVSRVSVVYHLQMESYFI